MSKEKSRYVPTSYWLHQGKPESDVAENGFVEYFYPKDGLNIDSLEFNVEGNAEQLIHPNKTYLRLRGKVSGIAESKTGNDYNTVAKGNVNMGFVNNIFSSIFESVDVDLNNISVTKTDRNYPYISYFDQLLHYGTEAKESTMQLIGWSTDTAGHMDAIDDENKGMKKRNSFFNNKQEIELIGKICSPLFKQGRVLPTMVTLRVMLKRMKERFFMMHEPGEFKFELTEAVLMVQKTNAVPGMREAYLKMMKEGKPAVIHMRNMQVNHISISQSMSEKTIDNLFLGKIPERVIIGMVETGAYIGDPKKNPFNFQHFDLAEICMYKDGIPYPRPLIRMELPDKRWAEAYHHFLTSIKASYNRTVPGITPEEYKKGFTLFSYDMSPDQLGSVHPGSSLNMNSNIRLELKFHNPLPKGITLLVYYETQASIEIHKDRQLSVEG